MNWLEPFRSPGSLAVGWALVHFVWQGLLVLALHALVQRGLRGRSAELRYVVSVAALGLMALAPVLTLGVAALRDSGGGGFGLLSVSPVGQGSGAVWLPLTVALWSAGVLVLSLRLVGGWRTARRMATTGVRGVAPELRVRFEALAERMGVGRAVRFLESRRADVPLVVGWLRPVVLLPAGALLSLSPRELEAVVAHELAHVRRADYLVNLLQSAVEVLFFFHPAVWILSARVRLERELCCDDAAVEACGEPRTYARALVELEDARRGAAGPQPALAATDGPLLERVRRVLEREGRTASPGVRRHRGSRRVLTGLGSTLALAGLVFAVPACGWNQRAQLEREKALRHELAQQAHETQQEMRSLRDMLDSRRGAVVTIVETINGQERRWETRPGPDGEPQHTYSVNGELHDIDDEARAWRDSMLSDQPGHDRPTSGVLEIDRELIRYEETEEEDQ